MMFEADHKVKKEADCGDKKSFALLLSSCFEANCLLLLVDNKYKRYKGGDKH